ncbi:MAG: undecaprenyldiphospho-muramoylpentapeptide beta-N-acetylglucosaminyltransferase [Verrucomicrobiales bacterium]|nr:undecaprenyldiphospho-muramoylpentapeptide beta-N-acetylglucosaminyltransferase [Verrucomicrobiales bacterium]
MSKRESNLIAIACGGTGGHLFPGIAVGHELERQGCEVLLLISPKEVDQEAVRHLDSMKVATLPAVGLQNRNYISFALGFIKAFRNSVRMLRERRPAAVLAMGGFTAAPPVLAGRRIGAKTFLHESNAIPGRANRMLARFVNRAFVGFRESGDRLKIRSVDVTGTPVRDRFVSTDAAACRRSLELQPERPTLLIMGGSQGAVGVNRIAMDFLPDLRERHTDLQILWLAGAHDETRVRTFCAEGNYSAVVHKFLPEMELAYGASTVAIARSGASTLSEFAAMQLPSILIPLPSAADNHQYHNALNFKKTGAARLLPQKGSEPEQFCESLSELISSRDARDKMRQALSQWHRKDAAAQIASSILHELGHSSATEQTAHGGEPKNLNEVEDSLRLALP